MNEILKTFLDIPNLMDLGVFLCAVITMAFLIRFYYSQVNPIPTEHSLAKIWKNAWLFIIYSYLFFILAQGVNISKLLNIGLADKIGAYTIFLELLFIIFLGAGFFLLQKRFK